MIINTNIEENTLEGRAEQIEQRTKSLLKTGISGVAMVAMVYFGPPMVESLYNTCKDCVKTIVSFEDSMQTDPVQNYKINP